MRALAVRLVSSVIDRGRALDEALAVAFGAPEGAAMDVRDRGLARLIAVTVLRRRAELDAVVSSFIERPLPKDRGLLSHILHCAAAQLLLLDTPPHAVINIAVEQCRRDKGARRFDKLANAVLRRVSERGRDVMAQIQGSLIAAPDWMWARWVGSYGEVTARRVLAASMQEAPLDLTLKDPADAVVWAEKLGGVALGTGTVRVREPASRVEAMPGFDDGAWWVQDVAAALPARLLGDVARLRVADLCAAPGGKTAQLASRGADVTAIDVSEARLGRVRENLARLKLSAHVIAADVTTWTPPQLFDAVLLDAPCTASGTIRRHPDIPYLKRPSDLAPLAELQARLLDAAARMVRPGGMVVYCTCSLEPEEGEGQVADFLARNGAFVREAIAAGQHGIAADWISPAGDLRTLPFHEPSPEAGGGMDGFFAARLRRLA